MDAQGKIAIAYVEFKAILDVRFTIQINTFNVFTFRNCMQESESDQALEDYITQLQRLAISAAVSNC